MICARCSRGIAPQNGETLRSPILIGGRRYCSGHCMAVDQAERSERQLLKTGSPRETAVSWDVPGPPQTRR